MMQMMEYLTSSSDHVMHHSMLVVMVCSSMQHAMLYTITTSMEM